METKKLLVVASVERTGSTLLCSILRGTLAAGTPVEYLNIHTQNFVRFRDKYGVPTIAPTRRPLSALRKLLGKSAWRDISYFAHRSYLSYLTRLAEINTTPNGVFGIKMHWNQYKRHMLDLDLNVNYWGVPVRWVRIMRQNEIRQAISFVRASQSESWNSNMAVQREPIYDGDAIETALARISDENTQWQKYFVDNNIVPLDITYEQLTRDMDATVRLVMNIGKSEGAIVHTGGTPVEPVKGGIFIPPTIFKGVKPGMRIEQEEIFGPVLGSIRVTNDEDAVRIANDSQYGLAAALWTRDVSKAHKIARQLRAGTVWVNTFDRGSITTPFGGFKQSGTGRDRSLHSIEGYTNLKTTWIQL